ncbi:MAG: Hsp70 family protein [Thermoguttaceae bacterium]|nr:Hsp70 family protein [Thermoguttaceae bacterium]
MSPSPSHGGYGSSEPARFVVGIDLGTTNSAVCYVDTQESDWQIRTFRVPQLVAPAQIEAREILPSFHYQPAPKEFPAGSLRMPWQSQDPEYVVGFFARDHGALVPGRLISSAKSWLCHSGVDRTAPLLPWQAAPDCPKISPIEASARYLRHIREAWDHQFPDHPLAQQDIVLTLPASFDEVARQLTVRAAAAAGLPKVVLLEEPQAAFYAWIYAHQQDWHLRVQPGQKILVCDIGGGTTDFTLIRVRLTKEGRIQFHRVAVGNHLILGGDNLDLALAHHVEQRLRRLPNPSAGHLPCEAQSDQPSGRSASGVCASIGLSASSVIGSNFSPQKLSESEQKISSRPSDSPLTARQWAILVSLCRQAKEVLLAENAPERYTLTIPGTGARLIGGAISVELTKQEVEEVLIEGFFPRVPLDARPATRRSGFQEFGLPYAPDPAVTRYLAAFLTTHRHAGMDEGEQTTDHDPARPDMVLFNGGVFYAPTIRRRITEVITDWFNPPDSVDSELKLNLENRKFTQNGASTQNTSSKQVASKTKYPPSSESPNTSDPSPPPSVRWQPIVLENDRLDLAVAQGAAYYGLVRRGQGVRIAAGLARTYYVGVEKTNGPGTVQPTAICLIPAGVEPGQQISLTSHRFHLRLGEPVEFPLYFSSTRLTDRPGDLVPIDPEQLSSLPPIRTVLRTRKKGQTGLIEVVLQGELTEIGTLELWCMEPEGEHRWRLEFDVRSATQTDLQPHHSGAEAEGFLDESVWQACRQTIQAVFGPQGQAKPAGLVKQLAQCIGTGRDHWPASLLRRIWELLMDFEPGRRRSESHEARWLNLVGYALRPGYGLSVDDWRVAETWRRLQGKLYHPSPACRAEWWVLWRRIAGGLSAGQQQALADPLLAPLRAVYRQLTTSKQPGKGADLPFSSHELAEIFRLLGSLERLPVALKLELGSILLELVGRKKWQHCRGAILWAIGRLGARQLTYGPLNTVVPAEKAAEWVDRLLKSPADDPNLPLALMQLARRTEDRYRDLPDKSRQAVLQWLADHQAPDHFLVLVRDGGDLHTEEEGLIFGESLPIGLRLIAASTVASADFTASIDST